MSVGADILVKIINENRLIEFSKLKREWFEDYELKLYDAINTHFSQYNKLPDTRTFKETYEDPLDSDLEEPFKYYYDKLAERVVLNKIRDNLQDINKLLNQGKGLEIFNQLKELVNSTDIASVMYNKDVMDMKELLSVTYDSIVNERGLFPGVPTGWNTLDKATGGLRKGDIFLILARVKMGKTAALLHMANAAIDNGELPMIISMEMSAKQMGSRLCALRAGLNMTHVDRRTVSDFAIKQMRTSIMEIENKPLFFVNGQFKSNIDEIASIIINNKPSVVYLDGGYLIKDGNKGKKQKWEATGDVIERLKTVIMQEDIPLAVSYQFNRKVNRKTQSLGTNAFERVQLSDAISQIASTGISILDDEESLLPTRIIEIIGGRGGEKGRFKINWNWDVMDFSELPEETDISW